ncbi:MAG TPA: AMP-dependent synthetase [Bacteroidales bacterium]|nr:AMP-dependent synthetase [Bacteroidales bacterium]
MKRTVIQMLRNAVTNYPDSQYVLEKDDSGYVGKKYAQVQKEAECFAISLLINNFTKGDRVALLSEGRSSWVVSEYGILMSGGVCVPLSIKLIPEEILFRINHSGAKAVLVSKNTYEKVLSIVDKIEIPEFKLIYFDSDLAQAKEKCQTQNPNFVERIVSYNAMVSEGMSNYLKHSIKLAEIEKNIDENDEITISYTSGTTGNPKGIMLTHLNYYANSRDAMDYFNVAHNSRLLIILPLDHSFAHTVGIYASLWRGIGIYFVDARGGGAATLKNIPINMKEANAHFMLTVPALSGNFMKKIQDGIEAKGGFAKWLFYKGLNSRIAMIGDGYETIPQSTKFWNWTAWKITNALVFSKVRTIFGDSLEFCVGGGALLDVKQQRFFNAIGIPIYQGYGLTEATPIISANTPQFHKFGSSGGIIPTIQLRIADENGKSLPQGVKGEIVIRGENVMKGYYRNPEATAKTVKEGELFTGDLGWVDNDNFLIVVGREKALLISQDGEKYSPEEIEEAIMTTSELVSQAMVYNDHQKYTVAVITLEEAKVSKFVKDHKISDPKVLIEEIKKSMMQFKTEPEFAGKFPEQWIPSSFRIAPELFTEQNFMINSTMKMVRYKITEAYKPLIDEMYAVNGKNEICESNLRVITKYIK